MIQAAIERCAGIDVGKKWLAVCIMVGPLDAEPHTETRRFGTNLTDLEQLRDGPQEEGITHAVMESTGGSAKNRIQKVLEDANVKLGHVLSDVLGVSGQLMLEALLDGQGGPQEIAQMAKRRARKKIPELVAALEKHRMSDHHRHMICFSVEHLEMLEKQVARLDEDMEAKIQEIGLARSWELLPSIPGMQPSSSAPILAETGPDMRQFGDERHLSAWAGQYLSFRKQSFFLAAPWAHSVSALRNHGLPGARLPPCLVVMRQPNVGCNSFKRNTTTSHQPPTTSHGGRRPPQAAPVLHSDGGGIMKPIACFLFAALAFPFQQPAAAPAETKPEDRCTVEGQVLNNATGAPIRKAELSLRSTDPPRGSMPVTYTATSDAAGKFAITGVEPGEYRLWVQRTGFVDMQYGARGPGRPGATLSLRPGGRLKDANFRLIPHAVIAGRIVDEANEPAVSVSVQAMRYRYLAGRRQLANAGFAQTNDLGEYRIYGLAPGRYYLVAQDVRHADQTAVDRSAVPPVESYVPTFYPGTPDASAAAVVEAGPGMQLRGVSFALVRAKTVRVRGRVDIPAGVPPQNVNVAFFASGQSRFMYTNSYHMTDSQGNFEIDGARPGTYTVEAELWDGDKIYSARQEVAVGENNVDDLTVTLAPGATLSGRFVVEGTAQPDLGGVFLFLRPREDRNFVPNVSSVVDNAFTVSNAAPEVYTLFLSRLPDGYWVRSVRLGDEEVKVTGIDLTRGPAGPLTITLAPNAGQVDGAVIDDKQQPAAGAFVVLVPEPKLRDRDWAYKMATTDQNGRFSLKNLDPGEYKLFAWEDMEYGEYMDPDFLKPVENRGQDVSIHEGSRETVQLNLIPAESAAKVQKEDK